MSTKHTGNIYDNKRDVLSQENTSVDKNEKLISKIQTEQEVLLTVRTYKDDLVGERK